MKIRKSFVAVLSALVSMLGMAETATVDGLLWQYSVSEGKATIEKLLTPGVENMVVPGEINDNKVVAIGNMAFKRNENIRAVSIPEGVTNIGTEAFQYCSKLLDAKMPSTLKRIERDAFTSCNLRCVILPVGLKYIGLSALWLADGRNGSVLRVSGSNFVGIDCSGFECFESIEFLEGVPVGFLNSDLYRSKNVWISYPQKYAAEWSAVVSPERFAGYVPESSCKVSVSSKMRENAPTIMDVKMMPVSTRSEVKIRPVAFRNGVNSFGNVVKVKTFADGTENVVLNPVKANRESVFAWNVAADLTDKVAKLKMDVMCVEDDVIPLELVTIPASSEHTSMTISRNVIAPMRIRDGLMWLLASPSGDVRFDVIDRGACHVRIVLQQCETVIYDRNLSWSEDSALDFKSMLDGHKDMTVCKDSEVKRFVLEELGYTILEGDDLEYARKMTGLKLENGPYVKMK